MLSTEACVSPDGSTVSYFDDKTSCASMGLDVYHWRPEPFYHIWMWLQTPAGQIITMVVICTILVLVLEAKRRYSRAEPDVDRT